MINFKDPKDQVPSLLAVLGIVLLCGSIVGLFMNKKVPTGELVRKNNEKRQQYIALKKRAEEELYAADQMVDKNLWVGKVSEITPTALAKVSRMVSDSKLNLVSFRPQKALEGAALLQIQYNLSVDGSYTNVATLVNRIENSDAKLAVNSIQYASAENDSDKVTATIGLVAFHDIVKAEKTTSTSQPTPDKSETKS
jgi:Tfp pilus assembly protein PilO